MDRKINPIVFFTALILLSIASSFFSAWGKIILFSVSIILPFFVRVNTFKLWWRMRIMLLTALLILLFGFIEKEDPLSIIGRTSLFMALVTLYASFVLSADLLSLSSTLGKVLSVFFSSYGWKFSSYLMLSLSIFPIVFECGTQMLEARRSRCGTFFSHPVKNLSAYTISLITLLFDKTLTLQDALYSRSFSTKEERTVYPLSIKDRLFLILFLSIFIGYMLWKKMS